MPSADLPPTYPLSKGGTPAHHGGCRQTQRPRRRCTVWIRGQSGARFDFDADHMPDRVFQDDIHFLSRGRAPVVKSRINPTRMIIDHCMDNYHPHIRLFAPWPTGRPPPPEQLPHSSTRSSLANGFPKYVQRRSCPRFSPVFRSVIDRQHPVPICRKFSSEPDCHLATDCSEWAYRNQHLFYQSTNGGLRTYQLFATDGEQGFAPGWLSKARRTSHYKIAGRVMKQSRERRRVSPQQPPGYVSNLSSEGCNSTIVRKRGPCCLCPALRNTIRPLLASGRCRLI
jgi:hypothetical protein